MPPFIHSFLNTKFWLPLVLKKQMKRFKSWKYKKCQISAGDFTYFKSSMKIILCIGAWDMNFQYFVPRRAKKSKIVPLCLGVASLSSTFYLQILFLSRAKYVFFIHGQHATISLYWLSRLVHYFCMSLERFMSCSLTSMCPPTDRHR